MHTYMDRGIDDEDTIAVPDKDDGTYSDNDTVVVLVVNVNTRSRGGNRVLLVVVANESYL